MTEVAKLHAIDYKPAQFFDSWAVPNMQLMYDKVVSYLSAEDVQLVGQVMTRFVGIDLPSLRHAFVHGDLIKTNVIKAVSGDLYLLDFSVANWYPRIQELAVIAANLLFDDGKTSLSNRVQTVSDEYQRYNKLNDYEVMSLPVYALAAATMEFLGGYHEKFVKHNNSSEVDYWLNLGRRTIRDGLQEL